MSALLARRRQNLKMKHQPQQTRQEEDETTLNLTPETQLSYVDDGDDDLFVRHGNKYNANASIERWIQGTAGEETVPNDYQQQILVPKPRVSTRHVAPDVANTWLQMGETSSHIATKSHRPTEVTATLAPTQEIFCSNSQQQRAAFSLAPTDWLESIPSCSKAPASGQGAFLEEPPTQTRRLFGLLRRGPPGARSQSRIKNQPPAEVVFSKNKSRRSHKDAKPSGQPSRTLGSSWRRTQPETVSVPSSSTQTRDSRHTVVEAATQHRFSNSQHPQHQSTSSSSLNPFVACSSDRSYQPSNSFRERQQPVELPRLEHSCPPYQASLFDSPSDLSRSAGHQNSEHPWTDRRRHQEQNEASQWRSRKINMTTSNSSSKWKTAVDPKSGKTYYYHTETRETQWRKPMELASEEEREAATIKEQKQRDFFSAMEANILRNLQTGGLASPAPARRLSNKEQPKMAKVSEDLDSSDDDEAAALERPNLVRTISSMDEHILRDLVLRVPSHRNLLQADDQELGPGGSWRSLGGMMASDGSMEDMELLESAKSSGARNPNALRQSLKQVSLGTMLATLPEEDNSSLNAFELSFGEESHMDMGLSQQESDALIKLSHLSTEMAMVGEESVSEMSESFGALMENDEDSPAEQTVVKEVSPAAAEPEDPLANMDDGPRMSREAASQRLLASSAIARPKVSRRNTCSTIYVGSTMAAPDVDATIKCVCGVVRAHILQSEMDRETSEDFALFNDQESRQRRGSSRSLKREKTPSLDDITTFYRDVFGRAQMESDCVIMSLIYVERLIKNTRGNLRPRATNWRSVLFSCMVLASKVWDDLSMWNGDFSQTCPAGVTFTLQRINELELAVLDALEYIVKVPASEYAKYYFLLRSMLIKSGLGGEDLNEMNPLDVDGARRLQAVSTKYQRAASLRQVGNRTGPRSKSLTIELEGLDHRKIGLEHIVDM
eukprot:CAMPEP_0172455718 /NCGR_PEP_ID=MMETSP1065-20121228/12209_1 /TAXON_ID=265537 /ORGANISM="Amphiprora paludosa, Strain CCMP125" /LENGTH=950 /DNA_ID=CAMNT_0013208187 /DNA_START=298 /DNA_END=3150 /DNA_ORIENTATION=-